MDPEAQELFVFLVVGTIILFPGFYISHQCGRDSHVHVSTSTVAVTTKINVLQHYSIENYNNDN